MGRPCTMPASMLCATHNARFVCKPLGRASSSLRGRCFPRGGEMDFLRRTHASGGLLQVAGSLRTSPEREFDVSSSFADAGMGRPCTMLASMLCATHNACFVCKPLGRASSLHRGRHFPQWFADGVRGRLPSCIGKWPKPSRVLSYTEFTLKQKGNNNENRKNQS